jgi:tol-pal system protein YbgF
LDASDYYGIAEPIATMRPMTCFRLRALLALALMVFSSLAGGQRASAQEGERPAGLLDLFFGGSERIAGSERSAQPALDRTAPASGSDLVLRLERLEAQMRQLTGIIEQLQFRNQQLESQIRRMQEDADAKPGARGALTSRAPYPQSTPAPAPASPRRGDAFDPTQNPNAPGAPHTLGSVPATSTRPAAGADIAETSTSPARGSVPGTVVATAAPSQNPKDEFDLAYGYMLRKDYVLAEESFRGFLSKHPNDRLTGDATFWLGESFYQRQRYRDAAETFLTVSTKFEGSAKAPDALLRLGQSLAAIGEKEAACASLGEVQRKFPRAAPPLKQGVEREQKRVGC